MSRSSDMVVVIMLVLSEELEVNIGLPTADVTDVVSRHPVTFKELQGSLRSASVLRRTIHLVDCRPPPSL